MKEEFAFSMTKRKLNFLAPSVLIVPVNSDDLMIVSPVLNTLVYIGTVIILVAIF